MRNKEFSFSSEPPVTGDDYFKKLPQTQRRRSLRKSSWRVVFVVALVVLVVSLVALGAIALSYFQGQQKYSNLAQNVKISEEALVADEGLSSMRINWTELRATNPDIVAWVYVPNTRINYPVVWGDDNSYYLTHDFEGQEGWIATFGTIFMDYRDVPNWQDDAYFFYGHHMNDGSMFAPIAQMADQATFDDTRTVYLFTPQGNFKLRSFSLVHCDADTELVQITFTDSEKMRTYVQERINESIVNVGTIPQASDIDKVFCFATCDNYSMGRYALFTYIEETTVRNLTDMKTKEQTSANQSSVKENMGDSGAGNGGASNGDAGASGASDNSASSDNAGNSDAGSSNASDADNADVPVPI